MTKRAGVSASNDPGLSALLSAKSDAICLVAKSWDYHVEVALGCTNEENLDNIRASVEAVVASGREAMVDCEHFFDGYKANSAYALACAKTAFEAGARWVVLCDTNGGTQPPEIREIVSAVIAEGVPGANLGIHAHNDTGQAVANSLAAVEAGVRQIQGTLNGIGERCGNANLVTLIATLALKETYSSRFETGIDAERLQELTKLAHAFDELLNRSPDPQAPMSALRLLPPRPAFTPPRCSRIRGPTSMSRRKASATCARSWSPIRRQGQLHQCSQAARHHGLQGRSAARQADLDRQGTRGDGLCL